MIIDRRSFLKFSALGASTYFLPQFSWAQTNKDPHQVLHIHFSGAMDFTYGFDARPLAMTKANLLQNYMNEEPYVWTAPVGGNKTLATSLTKPLQTHAQDFSIINGIYVDSVFASHPQAENLLFTGNAFGGDSYLPYMNLYTGHKKTPLDGLKSEVGFFFLAASNMGGHLPFGSTSIGELADKLKKNQLDSKSYGSEFLQQRLQEIGSGTGKFSEGVRRMATAQNDSAVLSQQITKTNLKIDPSQDADIQFLNLFNAMSQQKSIRTGLMVVSTLTDQEFDLSFDTHAAESAKEQPQRYKIVYQRLANILDHMKKTPYSSKESLFDVTTVIVTTEFGRTMRQLQAPIDNTGTDHNTFCTSFMIAGKGIKGGQIIGESDFHTPTERLSEAHMAIDKQKINIVAKPFDFTKQEVVHELPKTFDPKQYMNVGSVINTIFDVTGVDKSHYRKSGNGVAAQILPSLTKLIK